MTLTDHKVCLYIHICIYRHLYRSLLSQSSGIQAHSTGFWFHSSGFLWNPVESSGMDAFLQESVGHQKVQSDGGNILEVHSHGEVLLALMDCILESFPEGTWNHITYALTVTTGSGPHIILNYADSAANKHFFVKQSDFITYFPLARPNKGQPANKGGQFHIIGHGAVMKTIILGSLRMTITFKNTIHT